MEKEYSNEIRGKVMSYRFTDFEKEMISKSLKPIIKSLEAKIEKVRNHPKNEGQATYMCQIDELRYQIQELESIVLEFSKNNPINKKSCLN